MARLGYRSADFAGHSLRRGHATTASRNGASERTIMRTTGHTSTTTLRGYVEDGELFADPASRYLEIATCGWVAWFNEHRIHHALNDRSPADVEAAHYRDHPQPTAA